MSTYDLVFLVCHFHQDHPHYAYGVLEIHQYTLADILDLGFMNFDPFIGRLLILMIQCKQNYGILRWHFIKLKL